MIETFEDGVDGLEIDYPNLRRFARRLTSSLSRLPTNAGSIINYGERFRAGERISAAFVESTVNTVIGKRSQASRCSGHHAGHTFYCRSARALSRERSAQCSRVGIPDSQTTTPSLSIRRPQREPTDPYALHDKGFQILLMRPFDASPSTCMAELGRSRVPGKLMLKYTPRPPVLKTLAAFTTFPITQD